MHISSFISLFSDLPSTFHFPLRLLGLYFVVFLKAPPLLSVCTCDIPWNTVSFLRERPVTSHQSPGCLPPPPFCSSARLCRHSGLTWIEKKVAWQQHRGMRWHSLLSTRPPLVPTTCLFYTAWLFSIHSLIYSDRNKLGRRRRGWRRGEGGKGRSDILKCRCCLLPASCCSSSSPLLSAGGNVPSLAKSFRSRSMYLRRNSPRHSTPVYQWGLKILDDKCITCLAVATPSWKGARSWEEAGAFCLPVDCSMSPCWKQSGGSPRSGPHYAALIQLAAPGEMASVL